MAYGHVEPVRVGYFVLFRGPIVESKHLLIEIAEKMKRFHSNVGSRKAALQERPEVLKAIGVYAAIHVFNRVVDDLVFILFAETFVAAHLVSEECRACCDVLFDNGVQSVLLPIWDDLSANTS